AGNSKVLFGATVSLLDEADGKPSRYQIVGEYEADMKQGLISITSPLARALIGKSEGDVASFTVPGGEKSMEIVRVEYL
ncbi:MAG: GreA/GreB family elongation factor, partial [Gammaproteobacteria bacterium]|nr:GreA/GreB family elongation factor [Gammaproteobacteria bacterium]